MQRFHGFMLAAVLMLPLTAHSAEYSAPAAVPAPTAPLPPTAATANTDGLPMKTNADGTQATELDPKVNKRDANGNIIPDGQPAAVTGDDTFIMHNDQHMRSDKALVK